MGSIPSEWSSVWVLFWAAEARNGDRIMPSMIAAKEVSQTGRVVCIGAPKLFSVSHPPYPTGQNTLIVTVGATTLAACHLALNWRLPERVIDLLVEHENAVNGSTCRVVGGLAGALLHHGLPTAGTLLKPQTPLAISRRVNALTSLYTAMRSHLDVGRALLRGRYMIAAGRIEATGLPVDTETLRLIRENWPAVRLRTAEFVDRDFAVYPGGRFDPDAFSGWLGRSQIKWPRLAGGRLDLSDEIFREMARIYPVIRALKELRQLVRFDPHAIAIGEDGRNRTPLRPFASRTGRNQPSTKSFLLGQAAWVRHLVKPKTGTALAVLDWSQQEFGIAAALSGDLAMQAAYRTRDAYLDLAVRSGAYSANARPVMRETVRERFKACALGVQYGMGKARLARQLALPLGEAQRLVELHRRAYPRFWCWSNEVETVGLIRGELVSVFGWSMKVNSDANPRALRNYPLQANGAEMLRLACCLVTEADIRICAPMHDALVIEAPLEDIADAVAFTRRKMAEASSIVLNGFALKTKERVIRAPDRWSDPRGQIVWHAVASALSDRKEPARKSNTTCSQANPCPISLYVSNRDHTCHDD